jgi:hypothetical protein
MGTAHEPFCCTSVYAGNVIVFMGASTLLTLHPAYLANTHHDMDTLVTLISYISHVEHAPRNITLRKFAVIIF